MIIPPSKIPINCGNTLKNLGRLLVRIEARALGKRLRNPGLDFIMSRIRMLITMVTRKARKIASPPNKGIGFSCSFLSPG